MKYLIFLLLSCSLNALGPDFFVIGAQKGGTSSLYHYLNDHPEIKMPRIKELHFFDQNFEKGINHYLNQFPKKEVTGDITPRYLPYPKAPQRAFTYFPKAKLIVLLRNPIDRAFSRYKNDFANKSITETFEARIQKEMELILENKSHHDFYLERGFYAKQLKKWLEYYPKEQLLILISEDFFKETQSCMDKIYAFIGVSPHQHETFPVYFKNKIDLKLNPETRDLLKEFYRPYNQELQNLFNELGLDIELKWD
jgi:hypothetical protein